MPSEMEARRRPLAEGSPAPVLEDTVVLAPEGGVEAPLPPCPRVPTWTAGGTGGGAVLGHPPGWKVPTTEEWSLGWAPTRSRGGGVGAGVPWTSPLPWCGAHDHSSWECPLSEWSVPWRGASPWRTGAAWGRCWWGKTVGIGAPGPSCDVEAADQEGDAALPCAASSACSDGIRSVPRGSA